MKTEYKEIKTKVSDKYHSILDELVKLFPQGTMHHFCSIFVRNKNSMITVQIDENTDEGRELMREVHKRPHAAHRVPKIKKGIPEGYLTAEEWRDAALKMVDEVFDKHEKGLL